MFAILILTALIGFLFVSIFSVLSHYGDKINEFECEIKNLEYEIKKQKNEI